jgi:RNA polymerase sigma-70 factor, ECF subfamily
MKECSTASPHPAVRPDRRSETSADATIKDLRRRLTGYAVKLVWNRPDAEEVVQEAFKLALSGGPAFSEERFAPWMFRTVGNLCQNLRRRRKPEPLMPWLDPAHTAAPEARMERAEQFERLREGLEGLPQQQRMALVLRTMEQMEYSRIAEIMELSIAAVRTHVHLARERLIEMLGDKPGSSPEIRP